MIAPPTANADTTAKGEGATELGKRDMRPQALLRSAAQSSPSDRSLELRHIYRASAIA